MNDFVSNYTSGFGTQASQSQQTGISQTHQQLSNVSLNSTQSLLSELKLGDMFQGEILSVNGEEVQLALLNGQYLSARLEGQIQLAIGQLLNFQVQSNDGSKIVLKPIYQNLLQQQVGEAALKAAKLPVNEKNLQLVSSMIEQGMSIDKGTLPQIYRLVLQYPKSDLSSVLKMHKLNLPITEKSIEQFQQYKNLEHKLLDGMQEVSGEIQKVYEALMGKAESVTYTSGISNQIMMQKANSFIEQVIEVFAQEGEMSNHDDKMTMMSQDAQGNMVSDVMTDKSIFLKQNLSNQMDFVSEVVREQLNANTQQIHPKSVDDILRLIEQNKLDVKALYDLLKVEDSILQDLSAEEKTRIYDSSSFRKLLQDTIQKDWMLMPHEIGEENQVDRLYQRLLQTNARLAAIMNDATQGMAMQPKMAQGMQQNLEFMNQMNQMFQYVQLPIKLTEGQAHGELYVYTNKKHIAQNEGLLTALLHLDMEHLGSMDIQVSLQTQEHRVTTKFFLEEEVIQLVEMHLEQLNQRLVGQGYTVKMSIQERKDSKTVLERLEEHVTGTITSLSYQAFDIRM